jgi:threonine dehydrogenase-like Zn-dependent dehydrogenase
MRAVCWIDAEDVRVEDVPEPRLLNERDAIVKVTSTAICGSDLHLYDGYVPSMRPGDILGHEFMGEVVEVASGVKDLSVGDRIVVPFSIACGGCWFCEHDMYSLCDNSNPNAAVPEKMYGHAPGGYFGYSHAFGGYAGGQAEYVRVPFADTDHVKVPESLPDEDVLFLSDVLPTGWMAAENCDISPGDTVAVWGCGPVGLFAITSAFLLGAGRVIALDRFEYRLEKARALGAETLDYTQADVPQTLGEMTGGRGPDAVIDAVGMEAHGNGVEALYDRAKQTVRLETDRPVALRELVYAVRKGGTVSVPGVYSGVIDKFPMGAVVNKGLTIRSGQTHVQHYMKPLLERIVNGDIDPSFIITHEMPLDEAPAAYRMFRDKTDECVKVVLKP